MRSIKTVLGLCIVVFSCAADTTQKPPVIFTVNALIKQNVDARKKVLLKKLQQEYHRKNFSEIALWKTIRRVFDVPFFCNEKQVRQELFKFLENIQVAEQYPTIIFEGATLPPIMAAWNLGRIDARHVLDMTNTYINGRQCPEEDKKFYRALMYITFDPTVSKTTRLINTKAQKLLNTCHAKGYHTYLVGHCDPVVHEWLNEKCTDLLAKFDKILFSHQVQVLPKQTFDDAWWLKQLGLTNGPGKTPNYVYIDDWLADGARGDAPPHYASTSKALKRILA